mmetsp:Transcript_67366/g.219440  ORF Transcript_67366/g.219440 Transcript_67366/m.219440 type:complete len:82 (+) Transcript_67366:121-366(+)
METLRRRSNKNPVFSKTFLLSHCDGSDFEECDAPNMDDGNLTRRNLGNVKVSMTSMWQSENPLKILSVWPSSPHRVNQSAM